MPNVGEGEPLLTFPLNISFHIEDLMVVLGDIGLPISLCFHPVANCLNPVAVCYDLVAACSDPIAHNLNLVVANIFMPIGGGSTFLFFYFFNYFLFFHSIQNKLRVI